MIIRDEFLIELQGHPQKNEIKFGGDWNKNTNHLMPHVWCIRIKAILKTTFIPITCFQEFTFNDNTCKSGSSLLYKQSITQGFLTVTTFLTCKSYFLLKRYEVVITFVFLYTITFFIFETQYIYMLLTHYCQKWKSILQLVTSSNLVNGVVFFLFLRC